MEYESKIDATFTQNILSDFGKTRLLREKRVSNQPIKSTKETKARPTSGDKRENRVSVKPAVLAWKEVFKDELADYLQFKS